MKVRNTFIIFIVSGFWHGANWTFIIWGLLNALYFLPLLLLNKNRVNTTINRVSILPSAIETLQIISTFSLTVFAWIFFRSESIEHAFSYIKQMFTSSLFSMPNLENIGKSFTLQITLMIMILLVIEWKSINNKYGLEKIGLNWNKYIRLSFYFSICLLIFLFVGKEQQFIYFQF